MLDLDANLNMTRLAMGLHCTVDTLLSCNSWELSRVGNSYVDMVQVYRLRNMVHIACFHLEENYLHV
jgi:hypothetical protein